MKQIILAAVVGIGIALYKSSFFVTPPNVAMAATSVVVGKEGEDRALYALGPAMEVRAATLDYGFNSAPIGGSDFKKIGSRGMLSFIDKSTLARIKAVHCKSGQCIGSMLNECQANGEISHLMMIPKSPEVMAQMKKVSLEMGDGFRLRGRCLEFREGTVGGNAFYGNFSGLGYFLVEGFEKE